MSMRRKNQQEKVRRAVSIVFFDTKRDAAKSQTRIFNPKRRCVKTLAPVHQNHLSHAKETQRRIENRQISWDIQSKLIYSKWKSWKMLKHSLKIDKKIEKKQIRWDIRSKSKVRSPKVEKRWNIV